MSGECIGCCSTGVLQGNPLAGLFYNMHAQGPLTKIRDLMDDIKLEVGSRLPAGAFGYFDDKSIFGGELLFSSGNAAQRIIVLCEQLGCKLRLNKCLLLSQPGRTQALIPTDSGISPFVISDSGIKLLGNPVGTEEYRRNTITTLVAKMARPFPGLSQISSSAAYALLGLCYNSRPAFIARVADPLFTATALSDFDMAMDNALASIIGVPMSATIQSLRSLPQYLGGGGILRHAGPHTTRGVE